MQQHEAAWSESHARTCFLVVLVPFLCPSCVFVIRSCHLSAARFVVESERNGGAGAVKARKIHPSTHDPSTRLCAPSLYAAPPTSLTKHNLRAPCTHAPHHPPTAHVVPSAHTLSPLSRVSGGKYPYTSAPLDPPRLDRTRPTASRKRTLLSTPHTVAARRQENNARGSKRSDRRHHRRRPRPLEAS